jgi:hypothetical protein
MAELEEILQGYGATPNYWEERGIRPLLDTLRGPSPDWHPIIQSIIQRKSPNIDVKEVFREFRRAVARRLEATPIAWDSGKMSADERITFLELAAPELLPPWDEPPSSRGVGRADTLEMLQVIAGSIPDDWATLVGLLSELNVSGLSERWESDDLCQRIMSFYQAELAQVGETLERELTQDNWLTWCTLIWLPGTSLTAQLALLGKAFDCLCDSRLSDTKSQIGLCFALMRWELSERTGNKDLKRFLWDGSFFEECDDPSVPLNIADFLAARGEWDESAEALLTAGLCGGVPLQGANAASLIVAVDLAPDWTCTTVEGRVEACEWAVAAAPNPVAQAEVGLLLLEFADVANPPRYAANKSFRGFDLLYLNLPVMEETQRSDDGGQFTYCDLSLGEDLIASGFFNRLGVDETEERTDVLRLAVRAFGCALGSKLTPPAQLLCLDGLRSAFCELQDSTALEAACRCGVAILKQEDFPEKDFLWSFEDGLDLVRLWERMELEHAKELAENRLRELLGEWWGELHEVTRDHLSEAEAQFTTTPSIRGMSYTSAVHRYCCALEAQLRVGLGRDLGKYVKDPDWGWDGPAVNERPIFPYTYTLRQFQICLSKDRNKRILLDLLEGLQVDETLLDFFIDKLSTEINEIADCRRPVAHGDPSPQRDPEQDVLKVRRILLDREEEGGPALMAKLARFSMARRSRGGERPTTI